jgi:hypothetical protein
MRSRGCSIRAGEYRTLWLWFKLSPIGTSTKGRNYVPAYFCLNRLEGFLNNIGIHRSDCICCCYRENRPEHSKSSNSAEDVDDVVQENISWLPDSAASRIAPIITMFNGSIY